MTGADVLDQMLAAWREGIDSVPFPEFSALTLGATKEGSST